MPRQSDKSPITPLNLPTAQLQLSRSDKGDIVVFDPLRKKNVILTPEEWVRQNFVSYLTNNLGYPQSLMANETAITLNDTRRRCDTVVYDLHAKPMVIVEYKAPEINITQEVFDQIVRYNMVLHARCLIVSNGLSHYCCIIDYNNLTYKFLKEVPTFAQLTTDNK